MGRLSCGLVAHRDIPIAHQQVPDEFGDRLRHLRTIRSPRLGATLNLAREQGWTLTALGKAMGITRERVRQIVDQEPWQPYPPDVLTPVPEPPRRPQRQPRLSVSVDPDTARQLRELWALARRCNGVTAADDPRRVASERLSLLLATLVGRGVTPYHLAVHVLGCRPSAIYLRLGRHGYRPYPPSQEAVRYGVRTHPRRRR